MFNKLNNVTTSILEMFEYKRPAGSATEQAFIDRFLTPLGFQRDEYRNLVLIVGDRPNILFSSHVDTVHRDEGMQALSLSNGILTSIGDDCLGADDTAGIWLMVEMVKAKIPGVYVIHHAEEHGCIGSRDLADGNPGFFRYLDAAIAFDRKGYSDIVTYQMGRRCASDAFVESLADQLDMGFEPDPTGVFTDTAEYTDMVSECTNISVGYRNQHHKTEEQDIQFLVELRNALLKVDWTQLVFERDPTVDEFEDDLFIPARTITLTGSAIHAKDLEALVWDYPEMAAAILQAYGVTPRDFVAELEAHSVVRTAA